MKCPTGFIAVLTVIASLSAAIAAPPTQAGVEVNITGSGLSDLIFESTFEDPIPLSLFAGTYAIQTRHHLGPAYPRRPNEMSPLQSGDHVDTLVGFFEQPAKAMASTIVSIPELKSGLSDPDAAEVLMNSILSAAIEQYNPGLISSLVTVSDDVSDILEHPILQGTLDLPSEPDVNQVIANVSHAYSVVEIPWRFACIADPNAACDPLALNLRAITGDPTLTITSELDASVELQALLVLPAHPMEVPYAAIFTGVIEHFVIPQMLESPTVRSVDGLVYYWQIDAFIDLYNSQFTPLINCSEICTCNDANLAYEALYLNEGGTTDDAALIAQFACLQGSADQAARLEAALDGLTVEPLGNTWQTDAWCPFVDQNNDLIADGLGPVCTLNTELMLLNGDLLDARANLSSD